MKLDEAHAHAAQLAELLEAVLKRSGHLSGPAANIPDLIEVARSIVGATAAGELPVIVVTLGGGTIKESYGTHPARIVFVDDDIEGLDRNQVTYVLGEDQYVTDGALLVRPDLIADVLEDLAAHAPEDAEEEGAEGAGEPDGPRP